MSFGINTAYPHIRPDIWMGVDTPECYDSRLWWEPFMKICRSGYHNLECGGMKISHCPNTFFADLEKPIANESGDIFNKRQHDVKFLWKKNTFAMALHIMVWMGARNINLVGCDFGGSKDYYDDRVLSDERRKSNQLLYRQQVGFLKDFYEKATSRGMKITSCTPDSPINDFIPYKPLGECLELSQQRVPKKQTTITHAADVFACKWENKIKHDKGVIVGCAKIHEDLIPWWIRTYKKHNNYPIAFADFGMSDKYKDICRDNGILLDCTKMPVDGWFRKPFAILKAPFKDIIWCDTDIEVKKSLDPIFDYSDDSTIGVGWDSHAPDAFKRHIHDSNVKLWDSGLISVKHGNNIIKEWALRIISAPREFYYGDHEVLSIVLSEEGYNHNAIPKTLHRMRIDPAANGVNSDDLISMHWTGITGKNHIRKEV